VHQIIQEHAGTVEARSTVGKGTTFTLALPDRVTVDQQPTPPPSSTSPGKLVFFPGIPPQLRGQTGTYGP
jgi:hypothetical protein